MKALATFPVALLATLALTNCQDSTEEAAAMASAEPDSCDLVGSWEMVSMQVTAPDSVADYDESDTPTLKILNDTHWMFIRQSAERFVFAQGGRYELDGDTYTEIVEYSALPENIGQEYTFKCQVEGDTWLHEGGMSNIRYDEIWRRVTPPDTSGVASMTE
jgi:hypothetical protein